MHTDEPDIDDSTWGPPSAQQQTPFPPPALTPADTLIALDDASSTDRRSEDAAEGGVVALPGHRVRLLAVALDLGVVVAVCAAAVAFGMVAPLSRIGLLIVSGGLWVYHLGATAWLMQGQTAGKMVFGLRVRRSGGRPVPHTFGGVAWSIGRHTVAYVVADVLLLGAVLALGDRRRRCLHDFAFGTEVVQIDAVERLGSFRARNRAYWETFAREYESLTTRNRWFFWPWKWLSRGIVATAVVVAKWLPAATAPSLAPATSAPSVGLAGQAAIWTATTITTGALVISIAPPPPPDIVDLTGTWTLTEVQSNSSDLFDPLDFEGVQVAFEAEGNGFRVTEGPPFLLDTYVEPTRVDEAGVLARSVVTGRGDCIRRDSGDLLAADAYEVMTTWVLHDPATSPATDQPASIAFDYTSDGRKDTDHPAAATCSHEWHFDAHATAVLDAE